MAQPPLSTGTRIVNRLPKWIELAAWAALVAILLGSKAWLITTTGSDIPFWDQWDAEAIHLYKPWLTGDLTWHHLFEAHNEHRVFTTRLYLLGLLELNGRVWSPVFQMQVNAILHTGTVMLLLVWLRRTLNPQWRVALLVFAGGLMSIPFSWENTLGGFQVQFYLTLVFTLLHLRCMASSTPFSSTWLSGWFLGLLCLVSLGSGIITPLAGAVVLVYRRFWVNNLPRHFAAGIITLVVPAVIALYYLPILPENADLRAHTAVEFLTGMAHSISWPSLNLGAATFCVYLPGAVFLVEALRRPERATLDRIFILGAFAWLCGQFIGLSFGRTAGTTASRYLDFFAVGLLLNLTCLGIFYQESTIRLKALTLAFSVVWVLILGLGFKGGQEKMQEELAYKKLTNIEQLANVNAFLRTGSFAFLDNKPDQFIPYPDARLLEKLLKDPVIRPLFPEQFKPPTLMGDSR